jgi:hypothetical protein
MVRGGLGFEILGFPGRVLSAHEFLPLGSASLKGTGVDALTRFAPADARQSQDMAYSRAFQCSLL